MAVDDHGLEVLKKAGEETIPGDKKDYYIKTSLFGAFKPSPLAKYVEATYTDNNQTVTYSYYDSSDKNTAYEVYVQKYSQPVDARFTSFERQ